MTNDFPPEYREAALRMMEVLNVVFVWLERKGDSRVARWAIAYALALPTTQGRAMAEKARELGVTRAALSKEAQAFRRSIGLPPQQCQRTASAVRAYSETRISQL